MQEHREKAFRAGHALRYLDAVWRAVASVWALSAVVGAWILLLLLCAWVPQQAAARPGEGSDVARWITQLATDRSWLGAAVSGLGLTRIWDGWVMRVVQGLTAGWLALRWIAATCGWLGPRERSRSACRLEEDWETTLSRVQHLASQHGWHVAFGDDDAVVVHARRPNSQWRWLLGSAVWLALLLLAVCTWMTMALPRQQVTLPLTLGSEVQIGRWGIEAVRLERLQFRPWPDGTPRGLEADLRVSLTDEPSQLTQLGLGKRVPLGDAVARIVGVGPALRVTAQLPSGEGASLTSMSGGYAASRAVRIRLGGINQEHLVAFADGQLNLRLVEGTGSSSESWAVLAELLDGRSGDVLQRKAVQPPAALEDGGWIVSLEPEFFLNLDLSAIRQPLVRVLSLGQLAGLVLAGCSTMARSVWPPQRAVLILSRAGAQGRCVLLGAPQWSDEIARELEGHVTRDET